MLYLKSFTFNPFQENTYMLFDSGGSAFIIDPGNSNASEDEQLASFIREKKLTPVKLLLTHGHIDHVMGCDFVFRTWGLNPWIHQADELFLQRAEQTGQMYGVPCIPPPPAAGYLVEGDNITLGEHTFALYHTPGHSPGSISFFDATAGILIGGDVLFRGSIGRSDLPGGDHETLISSIKTKLFPLGDKVKVYSGHGPVTTIGEEKATNPFLVD